MSTYMPKAGDITRKWYVIDAADKPLGRVAAAAAHVLRGKHKVTYAPHADCGDHVIIINAESWRKSIIVIIPVGLAGSRKCSTST